MQLRAVSSAPPVGVPSCAVDPLYSPTVLALLGGPSRCDRSIGFPHRKRWTGPSRSANLAPGRHVRLRDVTPTAGKTRARGESVSRPDRTWSLCALQTYCMPCVVPFDRRPLETGLAWPPPVRSTAGRHRPTPLDRGVAHGAMHACMTGCHFVRIRGSPVVARVCLCSTYVHAHGTTRRRSSGAWVPCSRGRLLRPQVSSGSGLRIHEGPTRARSRIERGGGGGE